MQTSPVRWARLGPLSQAAARVISLKQPPLLVLAFGRSGSSWVGGVLGRAPNALYMQEPIGQTLHPGGDNSFYVVEPARPPAHYRRVAGWAYRGLPWFAAGVCKYPDQWNIRKRPFRRAVIKEVNPLACAFHIAHFRPRIIFLVRHPAAICLSHRRLGWLADVPDPIVARCRQMCHGWQHAYDHLKPYADHRIVRYEDLCADPVGSFKALYEYAGLRWTPKVEAFVNEQSAAGSRESPYATTRDSRNMIDAWRADVSQRDTEALKRAYFESGLPWYGSPEDW